MAWKDISIAGKLGINLAATCILLIIMMVVNWTMMAEILALARETRDEGMVVALMVKDAETHLIQTQQWLTDVSATRDTDGFQEAERHASAFRDSITHLKTMYDRGKNTEKVAFMARIQKDFDSYYALGRMMARAYMEKGTAAGNRIMVEFDPYAQKIQDAISTLVESQINVLNHSMDSVIGYSSRSNQNAIMIILSVIGMSIVLSTLITRGISGHLKQLVGLSGHITLKDLSRRSDIRQADEIGRLAGSFNTMSETLSTTIISIRKGVGKLAVSASRMCDISIQMANGANEMLGYAVDVAGEADQMAVSMEHVTGTVDDTARALHVLVDGAQKMNESISGLAREADAVRRSTHFASEKSKETSAKMDELGRAAGDIEQMTDLIVTISDILNDLATLLRVEIEGFTLLDKGFDAGFIKAAHALWKKKLSDMLHGKSDLKPEEISDHHACDFGRW